MDGKGDDVVLLGQRLAGAEVAALVRAVPPQRGGIARGHGPAVLETALTGATTRRDGVAMSPEVVRRRRTALNAVLRAAVRRELLSRNPMERAEWRVPEPRR
jgi:hypothetical protein